MNSTPETVKRDIRGVMINVTRGRLLLPNATTAEVITFSPPEPVEGAPPWLLGRLRWRGWRLPLISFSRLAGWSDEEEGELGAKVAVLKGLSSHPKMPYIALLTQGFPRLTTVSQSELITADDQNDLPDGVAMRVVLRDDEAVIPDLAAIEDRLAIILADAL